MSTLVLQSGGLDSAVLLAHYTAAGEETHSISFHYGQKHSREIECARELCKWYGVPHEVVSLEPSLFGVKSTVLSAGGVVPQGSYTELVNVGPISTYVPFRNGVMVAISLAFAQAREIDNVSIAAHASDWSRWSYPDCSPEFLGSMAAAAYIGTYGKVRLQFPFVSLSKVDIVQKGHELHVPFEKTLSCYQGQEKSCGRCPTCLERIESFRQNGLIDPLEYEVEIEWGT